MSDQLLLVTGHYLCHNCERDVDCVRKVRRFNLCDACWEKIMGDYKPYERRHWRHRDADWYARLEKLQKSNEAFAEWYGEMEERYPARGDRFFHDPFWGAKRYLRWGRDARQQMILSADDYWPLCECGRQRQVISFANTPPGLFGGPFTRLCEVCELKRSMDILGGMADKIHPEWDDEDWLDSLSKSYSRAFELGVLPDYWFEIRRETQP